MLSVRRKDSQVLFLDAMAPEGSLEQGTQGPVGLTLGTFDGRVVGEILGLLDIVGALVVGVADGSDVVGSALAFVKGTKSSWLASAKISKKAARMGRAVAIVMLFIGLQWKARKPIGIPRNPIRPWHTDGVGVNTRRAGRWMFFWRAKPATRAAGGDGEVDRASAGLFPVPKQATVDLRAGFLHNRNI